MRETDRHEVGRRRDAGDADLATARSDEVEQVGVIVRIEERHRDARVPAAELPNQPCEGGDGERGEARELEAAVEEADDGPNGVRHRCRVPEQDAGRADHGGSGIGQPHAAAEPVEQRNAELTLESAHGLRHGGLRDPEGVGGIGEPAFVDHRDEHLEPAQIHKHRLSNRVDLLL